MKILLTAKNSFVSRSIYPLLQKQGYEVDTFDKNELDLTNTNQLKDTLNNKRYDFVINPAIAGQGRLLKEDSLEDFYKNILMIENLLYCKNKYGKLIQFTSGAQENRNSDITHYKEESFGEPPKNKYSLAKYVCAKRILNKDNIINIRIFNAFGPEERPDRFISSCIKKAIKGEKIEIWGDACFDFFYYEDLFKLINYFIKYPWFNMSYEEINAVYEKKFLLSEIANIINNITGNKSLIEIQENGINKHYYADCLRLKELNLPLIGLEEGIKRTYEILKNERRN